MKWVFVFVSKVSLGLAIKAIKALVAPNAKLNEGSIEQWDSIVQRGSNVHLKSLISCVIANSRLISIHFYSLEGRKPF